MSSKLDRELMLLNLEDDDAPIEMPDSPDFSSAVRNELSLIGRVLNPKFQNVRNIVRDMPRKWQKVGKCRGVVLSQERFQFIFNTQWDLEEVLERGVHTFKEWALVIDRWYANPPENYLQRIPIWLQIWHLPLDYYTTKAITHIADRIGQVTDVAFDPERSQLQEYVRVKILFDVSRPLLRSKELINKKGEKATVRFHYERVQKRCYECQRLIHDRPNCPIYLAKQEGTSELAKKSDVKKNQGPILQPSDPLFNTLREDQLGIDPLPGRLRIAEEVLQVMRDYLSTPQEAEKDIRNEKFLSSVKEVEKDVLTRKSFMQLEPAPIIHTDLAKGKGLVFDDASIDEPSFATASGPKLMAGAINSAHSYPMLPRTSVNIPASDVVASCGTLIKQHKPRKRPSKWTRQAQQERTSLVPRSEHTTSKRKAVSIGTNPAKTSKLYHLPASPMEGEPGSQ